MKKPPKSALTLGLTTVLALALFFAPTALSQDSTPSRGANGQSQTLLPNSEILLIGGDDTDGAPLASASIQDQQSGALTQLTSSLRDARAWHSATVMPDGSVIIVGGLGKHSKTVSAEERFDPGTETFSRANVTGLTLRFHHTATLLTDGTLLVVGGMSSHGKTLSSAEIWNPRTKKVTSLSSGLVTPRSDHTATLQADGTVLIHGGFDAQGNDIESDEIYQPKLGKFSAAPEQGSTAASGAIVPPSLADSIPADRATGVAVDPLLSMRFSTAMRMDTVNSDTVTLSGPNGPVAVTVVPAEAGMLAFVSPRSQLAAGTSYTVTVSGVVAANAVEMTTATFSFTTAGASATGSNPSGAAASSKQTKNSKSSKNSKANPRPKIGGNGGPSKKISLPPLLKAPAGITALSGRVLQLDGRPLAGVTFEIGSQKTSSDHTGRFLLSSISSGKQVLWIEGATANHAGLTYGEFEVSVDVAAGQTTQLGYTVWMPVLDTAHAVKISSPTNSAVVVSNPALPGLELHLQAGTVIKDWYGHTVHSITITPIPVDQPPFPLPLGVQVPIYFTIQPGGSYLENVNGQWTAAQLYYPNTYQSAPGTPYNFWNYDSAPSGSGWYVYGQGKVDQDGTQIVPNPGVQIYGFTGAMVGSPALAPSPNPPPGPPSPKNPQPSTPSCPVAEAGDPVDCSTGLFIDNHIDLKLSDVIPLQFMRTYRTADNVSRPFGIGGTDSYEMFIVGDGATWQYQYLILPDGGRVYYQRTSSGNGFSNAAFENTTAPGPFFGSTIIWNGNSWTLTQRDGTQYIFPESSNVTNPAKAALLSITDRNGNVVTINRDSNGNITQITSPNKRSITVQHDTSNRITQLQDNIGRTVSYTYDSSGRLATVTDAKGGVSSYTYDSSDRMLTMQDPNGNTVFTNHYDTAGRVDCQKLADGSKFKFSYITDTNNDVTQTTITDPLGNVEEKNFEVFVDPGDGNGHYTNSNGYLTSETLAVGTSVQQSITWNLDPNTRRIESATDALLRETAYSYDSLGNVLSITRLAGTSQPATTSYTYDSTFNQITSVSDPLGHSWSITLDSNGNPIGMTDPLGNETTRTYNSEGELLSVTDPANDTTRFGYVFGDLTSVTYPLGNTTRRFTDGAGRVVSSTDPEGHTTQFSYDPLDRLTQIIDPIGGNTIYSYDGNENVLSVTDVNYNTTSYTYDSRDREITRTDALGKTAFYQYDADSNLLEFIDRRGEVTEYGYDNLNRRTFAGFGYDGGAGYESTIGYTWDLGDRVTDLADSTAGTISRNYDGLDDLTDEQTPQGEVSYQYDSARRRESMTVVGQSTVDYTWNNDNLVTGLTQGMSSVAIGYDNANRRTSLTLPNGLVAAYTYDSDSRVTTITYKVNGNPVGDLIYSFDRNGRVTNKTGSLASTGMPSAVFGNIVNADNEMTGFGGMMLNYDANGNLISDGVNSYSWDARNHLVGITGANTASFVYDAFGRRVQRTINGTSTQFLYDMRNPIQELQGSGPTANLLTGLGIDERFQRTDASGPSSYLSDALGSTLGLSNSAGELAASYVYEPFGNVSTVGSSSNQYQFSGRENDGTGLYFYRARYYQPILQRFISQDPIGFAGGDANVYAYVGNDSPNLTDPSGWQEYPYGPKDQPPYIPPVDPTPTNSYTGPVISCDRHNYTPVPQPNLPDPSEAGYVAGCVIGLVVCAGLGPECVILAGLACAMAISPPPDPSLSPAGPQVPPLLPDPRERFPVPE